MSEDTKKYLILGIGGFIVVVTALAVHQTIVAPKIAAMASKKSSTAPTA